MTRSRGGSTLLGRIWRTPWLGYSVLGGIILLAIVLLRVALPPLAERLHALRVGRGAELEVLEAEFGKIYSRVDRVATERMKQEFTAFIRAFVQDFGPSFGMAPRELDELAITLNLWEAQEALEQYYENRHYEDFSNNGGYYDPARRAIAIVAAGSYETVRRSAFHEATHLIFDVFSSRARPFPVWLSEGLAVYFEGTEVSGGRVQVGKRSRLTPMLVDLARIARRGGRRSGEEIGALPDLDTLLRAEHGAFRSENNVLYYAQSMLLTHYLLEEAGDEVRERFLTLCRDPVASIRSTPALARALQVTEDELREGFESFLVEVLGSA